MCGQANLTHVKFDPVLYKDVKKGFSLNKFTRELHDFRNKLP